MGQNIVSLLADTISENILDVVSKSTYLSSIVTSNLSLQDERNTCIDHASGIMNILSKQV